MEVSINRIGLLLKRDLLFNGRKRLIGIFAGVGLAVMLSLLGLFGGYISAEQYSVTTIFFFLIYGSVMANNMFNEWNKTERGYQVITLPASSFEKFFSNWVIAVFIYPTIGILVILLGASLLNILQSFGIVVKGDIFQLQIMEILFYTHIVIGSLFFLGGVTFKNNAFIKTIVSVLVTVFSVGLISGFLVYLIFSEGGTMDNNFIIRSEDVFENKNWVPIVALSLFTGYLGVVSYFKLKEREL